MDYSFVSQLLADDDTSSSVLSYVFLGIIVVLIIALIVWSYVSNKKKQKKYSETIEAVKPGSKVKTIGGIVGEVVEVNAEEGTFVLRTGDSAGNYSYMKFDKQAIYQTDAAPVPDEKNSKGKKNSKEKEEKAPEEEAPAEEAAESEKEEK